MPIPIHNANHQLEIGEIADMHLRSYNTSWDHQVDPRHNLEDISLEKVEEFIKRANKQRMTPIDDAPLTVLKKFELLSGEHISNGCHLLFTDDQSMLTTMELGRFASPTIIKDGMTLRTDLFKEVDAVLEFLMKHMNKAYVFTGELQRQERWDYPLPALREIIVNMVVHRDYTSSNDSIVKVYDDRIEFFNPGGLALGMTVEQLVSNEYISSVRNKQIASLFKEVGLIERYGSGIKRIIDGFRAHGLPGVVFEELQGGFRVTTFRDVDRATQKTTQKTTQKIKVREEIISLLHDNPRLTRNDLAKALKKSPNTIKEHIAKLKTEDRLERIGGDRGGYWRVVYNDVGKSSIDDE